MFNFFLEKNRFFIFYEDVWKKTYFSQATCNKSYVADKNM